MGLWANLFGSSKVVDTVVDGVYNGVDKAFYTDEEKAENNLKKADLKIKMLKAYEPFKMAQRFIALMTGVPFVLIHVIACLSWIVAAFLIDDKTHFINIMERLSDVATVNNNTLGEPFVWICIFYFGGGAAEGGIKAFANKSKG